MLMFSLLHGDKTPLERVALLERTPLFATIREEMASEGQSAVPPIYTQIFISPVLSRLLTPRAGAQKWLGMIGELSN
jgi:hypothetical protein